MITKPTLFILGAGASKPYGFPSGWELRNMICNLADGVGNPTLQELHLLGYSTTDIRAFAKSFMLSKINSIDAFLSRRLELEHIGKLTIAAMLIPKENDEWLNNILNEDEWYSALWNALTSNVSTLEELLGNKVRIFTFNYDRSLERYMHTAIMETFNVSHEIALEALSVLNIHHVYGSLGKYGLVEDNLTRAYYPTLTKNALEIAAANIKIIPESREDDAIFIKAREAYSWAENVCFLGFGFDPLNVQRLGFLKMRETVDLSQLPRRVVASTHDKTEAEVELIRESVTGPANQVDSRGSFRLHWQNAGAFNLKALRHFAWLLY
jgi:hypothetical protein